MFILRWLYRKWWLMHNTPTYPVAQVRDGWEPWKDQYEPSRQSWASVLMPVFYILSFVLVASCGGIAYMAYTSGQESVAVALTPDGIALEITAELSPQVEITQETIPTITPTAYRAETNEIIQKPDTPQTTTAHPTLTYTPSATITETPTTSATFTEGQLTLTAYRPPQRDTAPQIIYVTSPPQIRVVTQPPPPPQIITSEPAVIIADPIIVTATITPSATATSTPSATATSTPTATATSTPSATTTKISQPEVTHETNP